MAGELGEGDVVAGRYVVLGVIAEGGMGRVLAGRHLELDVPVAIKLLKREDHDARDIQRFRREARAAAHLRGEHVVRVLDVGVLVGERPFLVMERVDGVDLGTRLDADGPLPAGVAVDLVIQACEGLAEAHRLGMVHRDLKPSNLLLTTRPDGSALLKISDFGIAKWASGPATKLTTTADFLGSPKYMSPEQVREASEVDARSDVWSLGVTLYEGLTGRVPFEGETSQEVLYRILSAEPVAPRALVPSLSRDLETVVLAALEKDRTRRYASAAAFADDLDAVLEHRPVSARPTGALTRAWKWTRREPGLATAGVLAALIAVGGPIAYGVVQARNAEALRVERDLARKERERAEARTRDLEDMARFQGEVLGAVAPRTMAEHVLDRLRDELAAVEREPEALRARLADFERAIDGVNATNVAVGTLEDDVIVPMLAATKERFADRPHVMGMVLHTIGTTCWSLGLAELALDTQRTACETLSSVLPEDDADRLGAEANLGLYLYSTGSVRESEGYLRRAADGLARVQGPDSVAALGARHNLAMLLRALGRLEEAESVLRDVLEARTRTLGPDAPDTLSSLSNLGALLLLQRRGKEAEPLMREAFERRRRVLGPAAGDTLTTANNLGLLQKSLGELGDAEHTLTTAHEDARAHLGDRHVVTTSLAVARADVLIAAGCTDEALDLLATATRDAAAAGGLVGAEALYARSRYAGLLRDLHRNAEAERELEPLWSELDAGPGTNMLDARALVREFADLLMDEGRWLDAAEVYRVLARATAIENGPTNERAVRYAAALVRALTRARRFEEAERELDAARARMGSDSAPPELLVRVALELYAAWDGGAPDGPHAPRASTWDTGPHH